jgi:hypothetical protein
MNTYRYGINLYYLSSALIHGWKKHPKAGPFRNKGWVHYDTVKVLMPTLAKGRHVFRGAQSSRVEIMINSSDSSIDTHGDAYGELEGDGHRSNEGEGHSNKDTAVPPASSDGDSASPWAATGDSSIPPPSSPPSTIPSAPKRKPSAFLVPTNSSSISGSIDSGKR